MARLSLVPALALALLLLGATLAGVSPARAADTASPPLQPAPAWAPLQEPPLPAPAFKPPRVIWYGWESLSGYAAMTSVTFALLRNEPLLAVSFGSALSPLTTLTMHMLHGDDTKGYVSVGVSYGMIIAGGVIGGRVACGGHGNTSCVSSGVLAGVTLGGASAVILDAAFLAWGAPVPDPPAQKARLWPSVVPLPGGAAVGLGGTF